MPYFRKCYLVLALILVLIILFSSLAFAFSPQYLPRHVYYEIEDGQIVKADYVQAVKEATTFPRNKTLYNAIVEGIKDALVNLRGVWVELVNKDVPADKIYIDYSEAIEDSKNLWEAIEEALEDGSYKITVEPSYSHVFEIINGAAKAMPKDKQAWLDEIKILWEPLIDEWIVTLTFDFAKEPFASETINSWVDFDLASAGNNVHIRGKFIADDGATRSLHESEIVQATTYGVNELLVFIKDSGFAFKETADLEIGYRDIKVTIGGTTYAWYGVED